MYCTYEIRLNFILIFDQTYTECRFVTAPTSWKRKHALRHQLRETNHTLRAESGVPRNKSLWVTKRRNRKIMSNPFYINIIILNRWQLTFLSHCVGPWRSCLRVPVGLLVVGSIAGQRGPCQRRVLDPLCNSKRHMFSRWGRNRCAAVLLVGGTGAKGSGTTWPTVLCVLE